MLIDQLVNCFVLAACFSSKMVCISDLLKVAKRLGVTGPLAPFLGFKNSSPREKIRKLFLVNRFACSQFKLKFALFPTCINSHSCLKKFLEPTEKQCWNEETHLGQGKVCSPAQSTTLLGGWGAGEITADHVNCPKSFGPHCRSKMTKPTYFFRNCAILSVWVFHTLCKNLRPFNVLYAAFFTSLY